MENNKPKVMIALPCLNNIHWTVVGVLASILQSKKYAAKYEIDTVINSMIGIAENRNIIVKDFLERTDFDYLVMIDSDNPPPFNFLELIDLDKDIIGLPTPINMSWMGVKNIEWSVFGENGYPVKQQGTGLEQVRGVGTGCVIIKRKVLEAIEHPFTTIRDADDIRTVGTDAAFCDRAREKGFEIWTHWNYQCRHFKEVDLLQML